ncbi:Stage III sporulation protein D [Candidatus Syntrophocurvum alkaliphilum]|uniref:Stage III sporulation protein D n=1 Tax=Candidatus Syntrophocurvum alkaliphilum TaxID=2293317 RepID=A0A6I6DPG1_9FIRM|nr:sporulation transcriptional regulator SpoIIID [Candidatus Syntrophocurvum alkaliphilum]QGU00738.1 Stage III sporulation protein D [Candidatus Syntrophocurvum alkaliphilum]
MQNYIRKRAVKIAHHILQSSDTVRRTAEVFKISKSTVHKDVSERLPRINKELADQVKSVLDKNKAERHLRGGEATKKKYADENGSIKLD